MVPLSPAEIKQIASRAIYICREGEAGASKIRMLAGNQMACERAR